MVRAMMSRMALSVTKPEPHQQAADGDVVVALLGERDGELIGGDQPLLHQQLAQAEFFALFGHGQEPGAREPVRWLPEPAILPARRACRCAPGPVRG